MDELARRRRNPQLVGSFVLVLLLAGVMAHAARDGAVTRGPAVAPAPTATACTNLARLSLADVSIRSTALVPAAALTPEYCQVLGSVEGTILFEVALPSSAWNGKFAYAGGGGYNGSIPVLTHLLARGYAAAGSDTGHRGGDMAWALNPMAQINYGHRATHLVTGVAKAIVRAYYGQPERYAYWMGCSNGGKMGLMEIQRYPDDYDAALIGNFVIDRSKLSMSYVWNAQALVPAPIPPEKTKVIAKATLAACDGRDGLVDGLIDSPDTCTFDPKTLTCPGSDGPDCLTPEQVTALEKIYAGPTNSAGHQLYPGFPPGYEYDYPAYITGTGRLSSYGSSQWRFQDTFMRYFVFDTSYLAVMEFDFDKSLAALEPAAAHQDAANPDLSAFKARGGKLIMYHGWADHSITPLRTVKYYNDIRAKSGEDTDDFVRLFMVPGLHHCTGGPGPNSFGGRGQPWAKDDADNDILRALDRWVEQGVAPDRIIATKFVNDDPQQGVARTRPLCPYPQVARWTGAGSIDDAANFVCTTPQ